VVRLSFSHPRAVLAAWGLVALIATFGVLRLEVETTTDSVLDRSSPDWRFYEHSQDLFGGDEIVVVLIPGDRPYDGPALSEVVRLSEALEGEPGVRRVDSLSTVPLVESGPDGSLSLEPSLADGAPRTPEESERLGRRLAGDRIAPRSLASQDGRDFAVNLVLEEGGESRYARIVARVAELLDGRAAWVSGVPIFRLQANERTRDEILTFVPLTVVLMGLLLLAVFRSWAALWIPLGTAGIGTWLMLGLMGALGVPLTILAAILPPVLLVLGCAYTMHFLCAVSEAEPGQSRAAIEHLALPVALSGLTTAVGFVAVSLVRIEAVRDVGAFGALGTLVVLGAALSAAPAALELHPLPARRRPVLRWLAGSAAPGNLSWVRRWRVPLLVGWCGTCIAAAVGIQQLRVETDVVVWFRPEHPVRVAYDAIRERLSGISPMNVVVEAPASRSVAVPEVVSALAGLTGYLEGLPEVGKAVSLADPLRQLHGGFVEDPTQPLPESVDLIEQYLLLLDSVPQMRDLVTGDHRAANVLLRLDHNGSDHLLRVARLAEAWWERHGVAGYRARTTGIMHEFAHAEDEIALGQLRGVGFSFVVIGVILYLAYRSGRLAVAALVPNVVPVLVAFGAMGFAGIPLDAGTVLVGNLVLGIAVDNTVHILSGFEEGRGRGVPAWPALREVYAQAFAPAVTTTLAVASGFLVLGLSGFTFTRHLGVLTSSLMVLCLLIDVWLLPALLLGRRSRADS
jgi:predicted RND superfamily exporter protein